MTQVTLVFKRDVTDGYGCIEFSWVPTGMRRTIVVPPGVSHGVDTFSYPFSPTDPPIVQVYVLNNEGLEIVSLQDWMFPPGVGSPSPIVVAVVEAFESARIARATTFAADGTTISSAALLELKPRICPMRHPPEKRPTPSPKPKKAKKA